MAWATRTRSCLDGEHIWRSQPQVPRRGGGSRACSQCGGTPIGASQACPERRGTIHPESASMDPEVTMTDGGAPEI